jgi:[calcium/calmodulin-dependent protein kinase] kinase
MVMERLNHPNIVNLLEVIDDPSSKNVFFVLEYCEKGSIMADEVIVDPLSMDKTWQYFREMLKGVKYLHDQVINRHSNMIYL